MNSTDKRPIQNLPRQQQGALILVTLVILLVVTMLGMASVDSTGLEMQMTSNSRAQQMTFEAGEYALSWVESNLAQTGYFPLASVTNDVEGLGGDGVCGEVCFSSACTNGYCFNGSYAPNDDWSDCTLTVPATEPYANAAWWADDSGKHRTVSIQNTDMTAKYMIEFWCYTARNPAIPITDIGNQAPMYRITTYVVGSGGKARVMLRSTVMEL